MGHTLLKFRGDYFEYGEAENIDEKGLTIGGYESAWLADLVASYVLEKFSCHFRDARFFGIYRDDGFVVLSYEGSLTMRLD